METVFDLNRFVRAQEHGKWGSSYDVALAEIRAGRKRSHWIWYIFPQIKGIPGGASINTIRYSIQSLDEARAYAAHTVLGARLREITGALLDLPYKPVSSVMGSVIDALKLRSCMTLFYYATGEDCFKEVVNRYFSGDFDPITRRILSI